MTRAAERLDDESLHGRLARVRATTERLCEGLSPEDCMVQSMEDASPVKWHLAHTSWFFEQFVLQPAGQPPHDARWAAIFNSYYVGAGPRHARARRGDLSRPGLDEVLRYRQQVTQRVLALLPTADAAQRTLIRLGLEHEQQHQELIVTDLKHHFHSQPLAPLYGPPVEAGMATRTASPAPPAGWVQVEAGLHRIGAADDGFAFDNECPGHRVWVEGFEIADRLVTEAEYLAFIDDGGYERPELWLSDGWAAREQGLWQAPLYWHRADVSAATSVRSGPDAWRLYTLGGWRSPRACVPVCHLSHYEADAYARWAQARLPTEAEWEVAVTRYGSVDSSVAGTRLEDGQFHPRAASASTGREPTLRQTAGDCWEWTSSAYLPYPGYRIPEGTVGEYNGKFMSGQMVLRGGSVATPHGHLRPTYRNFFPPAARWQFSGIRLARDAR